MTNEPRKNARRMRPVQISDDKWLVTDTQPDGTTAEGKKIFHGAVVVKSSKSQAKIKPDEAKKLYKDNIAAEPYIPINLLAEFEKSCGIHAICLQRKSRVVAGLGIKPITKAPARKYRQIVRKDKRGEEVDPKELKEAEDALAKIEKESAELKKWLDAAGDDIPLREVLERSWYDKESLGWLGMELVRSDGKKPKTLVHLPAHLIRRAKDRERFIYLKTPTQKVWYKSFGNEKHLNAATGEWSDKPLDDDKEANEMLFWYNYSRFDPYYGVPSWYPVLAEILGSQEARDFMLFYFTRRATPTYAIMLEGDGWNAGAVTAIRNFFRKDLIGDHHATLIVEVPEGGKLTFERMTDEPRWVLLIQSYLDSLRDVIISAHGLFPALVGVIETAHLGAGTDQSQVETFKTVEARPQQETLEGILNNLIIMKGMKIETQMLKLDELDVYDEARESQFVATHFTNAQKTAITLNEARKRLRLDEADEEWADEFLVQTPQGIMPLSQVEVAAARPPQGQIPPEFAGLFEGEKPSGDLIGTDLEGRGNPNARGNGGGRNNRGVSPTKGPQVGVEG